MDAAPTRLSVDFKRRRERKAAVDAKSSILCADFCRHGRCSRDGRECPYEHDPLAVSLCQRWLHGACELGESCPLSHEPSAERLPTCRLFLVGRCSNPTCAFPHVFHGADTPACATFARARYCAAGTACTARHELGCDEYAERGECALGERCKLGRARRRQKRAEPGGCPPCT